MEADSTQRGLEPAASIVRKLGGEAVVSRVTETALTAPYRWQHAKDKGGTDGLIPQRHHPALLAYARDNNIVLTAEEFLPITDSGPAAAEGGCLQSAGAR